MRNYLLLLALTAAAGCSVSVDVADENTTTADAPPSVTTEKSRTAVSIGLLVDQESEPARDPPVASEKPKTVEPAPEPAPPPPTPEPPSRGAEDLVPVQPARTSVVVVENVVNVVEKDVHRHTHYHYESPRKSRKKPVKVRVEVVQKPERDERCERLMREHLQRVKRWEAMFK